MGEVADEVADGRLASARRVPVGGVPTVLVIEHEPAAGLGLVGEWLTDVGLLLRLCRPYRGDVIPAAVEADGLLVLGGSVGPQDDDVAPWLPDTRALLRSAVADGVPIWGICLGAQLLAVALGGEVRRGEHGPEAGVLSLRVVADEDPLFHGVGPEPAALQFHQDAITRLPEGAVLLASSATYANQAFRVGACAWAVQFHPEVTSEVVGAWASRYPHVVTDARRDPETVVAELASRQQELEDIWAPVARRWAAEVRRHAGLGAAP